VAAWKRAPRIVEVESSADVRKLMQAKAARHSVKQGRLPTAAALLFRSVLIQQQAARGDRSGETAHLVAKH